MQPVRNTIKKFLDSKMSYNPNMPTIDSVDFWFENQMISNYKTEEKTITNIVKKHVVTTSANQQVKLIVYKLVGKGTKYNAKV